MKILLLHKCSTVQTKPSRTLRGLMTLLSIVIIFTTVSGCAAMPVNNHSTLSTARPTIDATTQAKVENDLYRFAESSPTGKLMISSNQRHLVDQQDQPFFWLADTAWELFRRLDKEQTERYLQNRSQKGFTVIQAAIVTPLSGWVKPNAAGHAAFTGDVTTPNEAYFAHVDHVVRRAASMGLVMALLPAWSDFADSERSQLMAGDNAYQYGRYLGTRYQPHDNIIWVLGGDTDPQDEVETWRAVALGLEETSEHLISFHPFGNRTSSTWFHDDAWLDFNMLQSGHGWDNRNYEVVLADYQLDPVKPIVDAEPRYENINGIARLGKRRINAQQVRKAAYNAMLSGALGHTYGANEIWQFYMDNGEDGYDGEGLYGANTQWTEALDFAGAWQMAHLRALFERYPWHEFEPANMVVRKGSSSGGGFTPAAVSTKHEAVIIYIPEGQSIELAIHDTGLIEGAEWFDPRNGEFSPVDREMIRANSFTPPVQSDDPDAADYILIVKTSLSATGKNAPIPKNKP